MNLPAPPRQRVQISTGDIAGPSGKKIQNLATARPFTQQERNLGSVFTQPFFLCASVQLDVIFPVQAQNNNHVDALQAALCALETNYVKARMELAKLVEQAGTVVQPLELKSTLTMLTHSAHGAADDVWCLDPRGVLTLHLGVENYQTLGLTGAKVPFKGQDGHVISLPLQPSATSVRNRQKRDAALKAWDARRGEPWDVLYCGIDAPTTAAFAAANGHPASDVRVVKCVAVTERGVWVPWVALPARPARRVVGSGKGTSSREGTKKDKAKGTDKAEEEGDVEAEAEDWDADMHALFEWVGMAGLGAQRLTAHDRPNAHVAVYTPPSPSTAVVGDVVHLRWRGFLGPAFVQSVVDTVLSTATPPPFVALTAHALPASPVSYIPLDRSGAPHADLKTPARMPRGDGDDTWCLIVAGNNEEKRWCLAESVGGLDARWG
ncbi:ribonuclease P 40kDa subunit-domain-containing protein [Mycena metata]|uniref:Ribonuclease P 40kDa subunit-domain-containing protein n=1 Tax=Mycena metata TaxID=1033252 RepID=A0AAD7J7Z1_9AGAR|nr:ribonuclease P 40kDa subunit-domain-containing protein [Mycena metata]